MDEGCCSTTTSDSAGGEPAKFVWPPRDARSNGVDAPAPQSPDAPPPGLTRFARTNVVDALARAERFWMTPTAEPLARRALQVGWAPDAPDVYCNRCGLDVGPHESDEFGCSACRDAHQPWDRFVRLGSYKGALRDWVHEVKYTRWRRLGVDLGRFLGESLRICGAPRERVLLSPTPMALTRRLTRGVDHSRAIADGVGAALEAPVTPLLRARPHRAQRSLPRSSRTGNVVGVFKPLAGPRLAGWTVVVVDDVRTTGATLAAQCRAIRKAWPDVDSVWAAAPAVTPAPDRRAAREGDEWPRHAQEAGALEVGDG